MFILVPLLKDNSYLRETLHIMVAKSLASSRRTSIYIAKCTDNIRRGEELGVIIHSITVYLLKKEVSSPQMPYLIILLLFMTSGMLAVASV